MNEMIAKVETQKEMEAAAMNEMVLRMEMAMHRS